MPGASPQTAASHAAAKRNRGDATILGPILVAVDISWDSRAALLWACEHAPIVHVPVTVLHVLHDPTEAPGKYSRRGSSPLTPMADTAEKMLSEFMAEVRENHPELTHLAEARTEVVNGLPARAIVDEAVRLNVSSIVVGSRGHTGVPGLMYGSTALKVVRLSPIPVTVVKGRRR
jgi:nucleotide-binding universal stress UspA family protein